MRVAFESVWYPDYEERALKRGTFYIDGGAIKFTCEGPFDLVFRDTLVTPGFFNSHSHIAMTLFRGIGDDVVLEEWLQEHIWPLESRLDEEYVYWSSLLGSAEMLLSGTTSFVDMYFWEKATLEATQKTGIRPIFTPGIIERPGWESVLDRIEHLMGEGALVGIGPHALYTVSLKIMPEIVAYARDKNLFIHMHLMETEAERAFIHNNLGVDYLKKLDDIGFFEQPVILAHGVHLSDSDMAFLGSKNSVVAHCPQSNLKLSSGFFRWGDAKAHGLSVGIGTDGAASNNNLNFLEELRTAVLLARGISQKPDVISPLEALESATAVPARILGLPLGEIKENYWADLIVWNTTDISMVPYDEPVNLLSHVIYSAGTEAISDVFVEGRWVVHKGQVVGINRVEVVERVNELRRKIRKGD